MPTIRSGYVLVALACLLGMPVGAEEPPRVVDLSLLVSADRPCVWPTGMIQFILTPQRAGGPSIYRRDVVVIDEHTGTQWDAPAHFVPPPGSNLPHAGPSGSITSEKVPAWQFVGEACVIDVTSHMDDAAPGSSFLITPEIVQAWEKSHRPVGPGDVVLFRGGYTDRYYKPFPEGLRFAATVLQKETPGWPAPSPECMTYLGKKGVMAAGVDSPSMGPVPDLAVATHVAGGEFGMIWTECATNLGALPATGAAYVLLPPKHAEGCGGEARTLGVTDPALAAEIIKRAKAKRVADLSVTLDEHYPVTWPGAKAGTEANRYIRTVLNFFEPARGPYFACGHMLDTQAGTHLVTPSFSLPSQSESASAGSSDLATLRAAYEGRYGRLGTSDVTVEQIPLETTIGYARVIDVSSLVGSTSEKDWRGSPLITVDLVKKHEQATRPIAANEVVLFRSGYSDKHFKPLPAAPEVDRMLAAPLAGKAEGWPAVTPEVIAYLAEKHVRCVGTDGPTLGGADPKNALFVSWAAGSHGVVPVEYLTNLNAIPEHGAIFLFAPIRLQGAHGGYGRAIALY